MGQYQFSKGKSVHGLRKMQKRQDGIDLEEMLDPSEMREQANNLS